MQQTTLEKRNATSTVMSSAELLAHWQGHRRLTRKMIEVFPEKELFTYSIGGMRPFSDLVTEMLDMATPGLLGVITGKWSAGDEMAHISGKGKPGTREELLQKWDETTERMDELWSQIPEDRFQQQELAFGLYDGTIISHIFYFIDNEIHHRAQGYVYLRSLGIEPPAF